MLSLLLGLGCALFAILVVVLVLWVGRPGRPTMDDHERRLARDTRALARQNQRAERDLERRVK